MRKIIFTFAVFALLATVGGGIAFADHNPLHGKIIALDAGHGGGETGAVNQKYGVKEEDVNWDVVTALETKLKGQGAEVVIADRLPTRKDRVNDAISKCAALDLNGDGVADDRKCDALVSVHHNGSIDPLRDGTLVIYNEKKDKPLAEKMLEALVPLTGNNEGLLHGGYGMTVYGNLVSVITEAYYITNDTKAWRYLYDKSNLVLEEVNAQITGLSNYFGSQTSGGRGGKPNK